MQRGLLRVADLAVDEAQQPVGIGQGRLELQRLPQVGDRLLVHPLVVENFAQGVVDRRILRIDFPQALEPLDRALQLTPALLGVPEPQEHALVARSALEKPFQQAERFVGASGLKVGLSESQQRLFVVRIGAQPADQLGDLTIVVAGLVVGDFEVAPGDLHLAIDRERLLELPDRFLEQPLLVEDHPEVVERARVSRIDPLGERPENPQVSFRLNRPCHALP